MKFASMTALVAFSLLPLISFAADDVEPPLGYTLQIGGKSVRFSSDEAKKVPGQFKDPVVKIIADDTRLFTYGGVSFKYPVSFGFEADLETPGIKIWTLDGNDFVITVQHFKNIPMTAAAFANQLLEYYGKGAKVSAISYKFNGVELSGKRVVVVLAGAKIQQDVLEVPTTVGSRILVLQDRPGQTPSAEAELVKRLLNTTFTVSKVQ